MAKCQNCGKTPAMGRSISFSHRVTPQLRRPNIQSTTVMVDGEPRKLKLCTRCLRTLLRAR